jgi:hypothetical protein
MEKYTGAPFLQNGTDPNPRWNAAAILNPTWDKLLQQLVGRLVVQGPMRQFFPNVVFNHNQDSLISSATLDTILTNLRTNRPTDRPTLTPPCATGTWPSWDSMPLKIGLD